MVSYLWHQRQAIKVNCSWWKWNLMCFKGHHQETEKTAWILANYISENCLVSRMYEELLWLNKKVTHFFKWAKDLNRHLSSHNNFNVHLWHVSEFHSFLRMGNIPFYIHTQYTFRLSVYPLMNTWIAPTFWLLWTWVHRHLFKSLFSTLLSIYPEVDCWIIW